MIVQSTAAVAQPVALGPVRWFSHRKTPLSIIKHHWHHETASLQQFHVAHAVVLFAQLIAFAHSQGPQNFALAYFLSKRCNKY